MEQRITPQAIYLASFNTVAKLIGFGIIFTAADLLIPGLYPSPGPVLTTVIALTAVGSIADLTIVPRFGNILSLAMGFLGMLAIIWVSARAWPGTQLTLGWAILFTLLLGPLEYLLHKLVLKYIP